MCQLTITYIHLGLTLLAIEEVKARTFVSHSLMPGNIKLELLEPLGKTVQLQSLLRKRGEGVHHIAFGVTDIRSRMTN